MLPKGIADFVAVVVVLVARSTEMRLLLMHSHCFIQRNNLEAFLSSLDRKNVN